jgi:hypothetical protein
MTDKDPIAVLAERVSTLVSLEKTNAVLASAIIQLLIDGNVASRQHIALRLEQGLASLDRQVVKPEARAMLQTIANAVWSGEPENPLTAPLCALQCGRKDG